VINYIAYNSHHASAFPFLLPHPVQLPVLPVVWLSGSLELKICHVTLALYANFLLADIINTISQSGPFGSDTMANL